MEDNVHVYFYASQKNMYIVLLSPYIILNNTFMDLCTYLKMMKPVSNRSTQLATVVVLQNVVTVQK